MQIESPLWTESHALVVAHKVPNVKPSEILMKDEFGQSVFWWACNCGNKEAVLQFVNVLPQGILLTDIDNEGTSCLEALISGGRVKAEDFSQITYLESGS